MSGFLAALRWLARLSGLLVAGGYMLLVVGEFGHPHSWSNIVLMTITCAGMLMAWRWELPGAAISLAALVAFTLLIKGVHHSVIFVLAIPGILYVLDWLLHYFRRLRPLTAG